MSVSHKLEAVSVVLPAFNAETSILAAIQSTLRSLGEEDELVIVEDGSTDRTWEIMQSIQDDRITMTRNKTNLGIARSLNNGILLSKFETIARMDADDKCPPWRFQMQKRIFRDSSVDLLFGTQIYIRRHMPIPLVHTYVTRKSGQVLDSALSIACILAHPTLFGKKSCLTDLGMYRDVVAEDYDLWIRARLNGTTILRHWMPMNFYHWSSKSVSKLDAPKVKTSPTLLRLKNELFSRANADSSAVSCDSREKFLDGLIKKDPLLRAELGLFTHPFQK